jgi:hypothetical protein
MSFAEVAFLLGPVGAIVIAPLAMVVLAVRQPRRAVRLGVPLMAVVAMTWWGFWYLWGRAFDYADAAAHVPSSVTTASSVLAAVCCVGCLVLAGTAAASRGA